MTPVTHEEKQNKKEELIEKLLCEHVSQRGLERLVCVSRNRLISDIKKEIRSVASAVVKTEERPVIGTDEAWSYVGSGKNKVQIRSAINRHTRHIVGAAFGDRGDKTCLGLRKSLPPDYRKHAVIYIDYRGSYADILPSEHHRAVGKETGETAHIERFNNMLRQRCPAMVRKNALFQQRCCDARKTYKNI